MGGATPGHYLCTCTLGTSASILVEIWVDVEVQCNVLFPRPYGGAYSQSPIPQLEQGVGMGHLSPTQTGNPGSITEIECTFLSGSAEQDALTMKESPLKNLILATPLMGVVAK